MNLIGKQTTQSKLKKADFVLGSCVLVEFSNQNLASEKL